MTRSPTTCRKWLLGATVSLVAIGLCACSYGLRPPVVEAGRSFSPDSSDRVKKRNDAAQVRGVLGEPYGVEKTGSAERWRYYMRVRGAEQRRLFGIIPLPDSTSRNEYEVIVTFNNGSVESVSRKSTKVE